MNRQNFFFPILAALVVAFVAGPAAAQVAPSPVPAVPPFVTAPAPVPAPQVAPVILPDLPQVPPAEIAALEAFRALRDAQVPATTAQARALAEAARAAAQEVDVARLRAELEAMKWDISGDISQSVADAQLQARLLADQVYAASQAGAGISNLRLAQTLSADREQAQYDRGTRALDSHRWQEAIQAFDEVIQAKGKRADGAMYWKAYAQNRLGQRAEALATLQDLQRTYSGSRWLSDAKVLEVEVRQAAGQPVRPEAETDEDLKLLAINALMQSAPDQAIPMLEQVLKGNNPPKVKERALFVLATTGTPKAREVLVQVAKGGGNPDLQMKAVRYLGMFGAGSRRGSMRFPGIRSGTPVIVEPRTSSGKEPADSSTLQALTDIYNGTTDVDVKREVLRALMIAGDKDKLLSVAKTEKSPELRAEAVRQLGAMGGQAELYQLYQSDLSPEVRQQIISAMVMTRSTDQLLDIARREKDVKLRVLAIRNLGMVGGPLSYRLAGNVLVTRDARTTGISADKVEAEGKQSEEAAKVGDALVSIYQSDKEPEVRKAVVSALYMQQNAKALVALARKETDPEMKKDLVQKLSTMKSKEALDYLMELLK